MKEKLFLVCIVLLFSQNSLAQRYLHAAKPNYRSGVVARLAAPSVTPKDGRLLSHLDPAQEEALIFPGLLKKEALEAGNPLATYAAMLELESKYRQSKIFVQIYPEVRFNFEEFLGLPLAGVQAMSLPAFRRHTPSTEAPLPASYQPED